MRLRTRFVVSLGLGGLALVLALPAARSAGQIVRTEDGIQVVRNPKSPVIIPGAAVHPVLTEDLVIGRGTGETDQFQQLQSVQADAEGRVCALDLKAATVRVFDAGGKHLRSIGRKGQGPGELSLPTRMMLTPAGEVAVMDALRLRIVFFAADGTFLRNVGTSRWGRFTRFHIAAGGEIYADRMAATDQGADEYQLMKLLPDLSSMSVLAAEPTVIRDRVIDAVPLMFSYGTTPDGGLAWAFEGRYEITVLDAEGKVRRKVRRDADPVPMDPKIRTAILRRHFGDKPAPERLRVDFPSALPPIWSLIVADTGHIIVRTYARDPRGGYIHDVFDPGGVFVSQFALSEREFLMMVRNGKAYTIVQEDEEGVPLVKRYALAWFR